MDVSSMLAGAGIMAVLVGFVWRMFAHYDRKTETRFEKFDRKTETRFDALRQENREAHASITENVRENGRRIDKVLEMLARR